jgi:hypothetical protein
MGQYDDITEAQLRADLVRFAELLLRLEAEGGLLVSPADLQKILGELRQKLFAWEIRCSRFLDPVDPPGGGPLHEPAGGEGTLPDSLRVVREAIERQREVLREWSQD